MRRPTPSASSSAGPLPDRPVEAGPPGHAPTPNTILRFGPFELRPHTGELLKLGMPVHLRPQSLQVLALLAEGRGQLVTREAIQASVWGDGTFVDFEQGLNHCIKEIRAALGDHAEAPAYVETLARRGYRFIVPVERLQASARMRAWRVAGLAAAVAAAVSLGAWIALRPRTPGAAGGRVMIAVLPFEDLSGDPEQAYFAAGLTEEIVGALGRLDPARLGVVGRIPAMEYRGQPHGLEAMRRDLGVSYVLAGGVRRSGDRVRITAGLTQISDKRQVWSEAYDRELRDILSVQRSVAEAVGSRILLAFAQLPPRRLEATRVDPEAYTLYLKARHLWNQREGAGIKKSIDYFEQSIARQPDYAAAYAGLGQAYVTLGQRTAISPLEAARKARAVALKSLELDADLAEGHACLAAVKGLFDWDWPGSEREFRRALDLNPSDATAHHWYSHVLRSLGRLDEALGEIRTAASLAPLSLIIGTDVGNVLLYKGEVDAASRQYQSVLEMDPRFAPAHRGMGRVALAAGQAPEAVAAFERAVALSDNPRYLSWLGYAYARSGREKDARAVLGRLRTPPEGCAYDTATIHSALGDREAALEWLQRAYRHREPALRYLMLDERLSHLRSDPVFLSLARRVGLPTG